MKNITLTLMLVVSVSMNVFSQLTVSSLMSCLKNNKWDAVNTKVLNKGFSYHGSEVEYKTVYGDKYETKATTYAYGKNSYSDEAQSWLNTVSYKGKCYLVSWQVHSQEKANQLRRALSSYGFKKGDTDVSNNSVAEFFKLGKYHAILESSSTKENEFISKTSTFYTITIFINSYLVSNAEGEVINYYSSGRKKEKYYHRGYKIQGDKVTYMDKEGSPILSIYTYDEQSVLNGSFIDHNDALNKRYEGFYKNGEIHGIVKTYSLDYYGYKTLVKEETYVNGTKKGKVTVYENGVTNSYNVDGDGDFSGKYDLTSEDGVRRQGSSIKGKKEGLEIVTYTDEDGNKNRIEQYYKGGALNGIKSFFLINTDGSKKLYAKETYIDDVLNGACYHKYESEEVNYQYKNGKKEGIETISSESDGDEFYITQHYKEGDLHGKKSIYRVDSKSKKKTLLLEENYSYGVLNGPFKKCNKGELVFGNYLNGEYHGLYKSYTNAKNMILGCRSLDTTNSFPTQVGVYSNGLKVGTWTSYTGIEANDIIETGTYVNGKKQGAWKSYFSKKMIYENIENNDTNKYRGIHHTTTSYNNGLKDGMQVNYAGIESYRGKCKTAPYLDTCLYHYFSERKVIETYQNDKLFGRYVHYNDKGEKILDGNLNENGFYGDVTAIQTKNSKYPHPYSYLFDIDSEIDKVEAKFNMNGQKEGRWKYYMGDELKYSLNYSKNKLHGTFTIYIVGSKYIDYEYQKGSLKSAIYYPTTEYDKSNIRVDLISDSYKTKFSVIINYGESTHHTEYQVNDDFNTAVSTEYISELIDRDKDGEEHITKFNYGVTNYKYWHLGNIANTQMVYDSHSKLHVFYNLLYHTPNIEFMPSELQNSSGNPKKTEESILIGIDRHTDKAFIYCNNEVYIVKNRVLSKKIINIYNTEAPFMKSGAIKYVFTNKDRVPANGQFTVKIENEYYEGKIKNGVFDGKVQVFDDEEKSKLTNTLRFNNGILKL